MLLRGAERDDPLATREDVASGIEAPACLSIPAGPARRLRVAPPVQLELLCDRQGPRPEVVWASLPERTRETVLVLLARLIGAGAIEAQTEEEGER